MANWFYNIDGHEHGPVVPSQIKELVRLGELKPNHLVRREDMAKWTVASQVKGLFESLTPAPENPDENGVSNDKNQIDAIIEPSEDKPIVSARDRITKAAKGFADLVAKQVQLRSLRWKLGRADEATGNKAFSNQIGTEFEELYEAIHSADRQIASKQESVPLESEASMSMKAKKVAKKAKNKLEVALLLSQRKKCMRQLGERLRASNIDEKSEVLKVEILKAVAVSKNAGEVRDAVAALSNHSLKQKRGIVLVAAITLTLFGYMGYRVLFASNPGTKAIAATISLNKNSTSNGQKTNSGQNLEARSDSELERKAKKKLEVDTKRQEREVQKAEAAEKAMKVEEAKLEKTKLAEDKKRRELEARTAETAAKAKEVERIRIERRKTEKTNILNLRETLTTAAFAKRPDRVLENYVRFGSQAMTDKFGAGDPFDKIEVEKATATHRAELTKKRFLLDDLKFTFHEPNDIEGDGIRAELELPFRVRNSFDSSRFSKCLGRIGQSELDGNFYFFLTKENSLRSCTPKEAEFLRKEGGIFYHPERGKTILILNFLGSNEELKAIYRSSQELSVNVELTDLSWDRPYEWGYFRRDAYIGRGFDCGSIRRSHALGMDNPKAPEYFITERDSEKIPKIVEADLVQLIVNDKQGNVIGGYNVD